MYGKLLALFIFTFFCFTFFVRFFEHRKNNSGAAKARATANLCDGDVEKLLYEGHYTLAAEMHQDIHNIDQSDTEAALAQMLKKFDQKTERLAILDAEN